MDQIGIEWELLEGSEKNTRNFCDASAKDAGSESYQDKHTFYKTTDL